MKKAILSWMVLTVMALPLHAQEAPGGIPISLSFTNNATQLFSSGLTRPIHPGITLGTQTVYAQKEKATWFQSYKLAWFYHAYSMHGFNLYTDAGYARQVVGNLGLSVELGVGYLLSKVDGQVFERTETGTYDYIPSKLRSQFTAGLQAGLFYQLPQRPVRLQVDYRFWLQAPFVKTYVPVLPYTTLQLGVLFHLPKREKS
jgi:hypothetical protein